MTLGAHEAKAIQTGYVIDHGYIESVCVTTNQNISYVTTHANIVVDT